MINKSTIDVILGLTDEESFRVKPTLFLYDSAIIEKKIELIRNAPKNVSLYYAMKANPNQDILKLMRSSSIIKGIEVSSLGEFDKASRYFSPKEIIFSGPGKTQFELEQAIKSGLYLLNVESLTEAHRINRLATELAIKEVNILLRVNSNHYIDGSIQSLAGKSTKFGIDEITVERTLQEMCALPRLALKGFHIFSASGVLDYSLLLKHVNYVFDIVTKFDKQSAIQSPIIDFGGGFGVDYKNKNRMFSVNEFLSGLDALIEKYKFQKKELILELGRYLVAEAGYYVSEIIDIKKIKGQKHIITAGGINHNRLPLEFEFTIPLQVINRGQKKIFQNQESIRCETATIGGQLCSTEDTSAENMYIKRADIGDLVVVPLAGAYAYSFSANNFLSHGPAPEFVINCGDKND